MVDATQAIGGGTILAEGNGTTISHDEFLTLLIAELANQDPLAPMESQEMATQLAQFGSLERLYSIDQRIGEGLDMDMLLTQAVNNTMAASLIGREVVAVGDGIVLRDGRADLHFKLQDPAAEVTVTIRNQDGEVVRTIQRLNLMQGAQVVTWNGADDSGRLLSDGIYHFSITASDADGQSVNSMTTASGIITGVSYDTGTAILLVGDLEFPMGNVISIRIPGG